MNNLLKNINDIYRKSQSMNDYLDKYYPKLNYKIERFSGYNELWLKESAKKLDKIFEKHYASWNLDN